MKSVFFAGPYNSQPFTTCCDTAICDNQVCCPRCGEPVYPESDKDNPEYTAHQRNTLRFKRAFGK